MKTGTTTNSIAQSLDCFYPGMKTLLGEIEPAMRTHLNYYETWRQFNGWPEFYSINSKAPIQGREGFPLRPEFIESTYYLYYATKGIGLILSKNQERYFDIWLIISSLCSSFQLQ